MDAAGEQERRVSVPRVLEAYWSYAPVGQTPILHEQATCDHLSVMSAITLEGKLLTMKQDRVFKGLDVVRFLKHAFREMLGKLLIIWDGSQIHRSKEVKEFLVASAAERPKLEQSPGRRI